MEFSPRIWVSIRSYARDEDHANDLLQDCWMAILNQLDQFKRNDSFASWTIKVSRNVCFDRLRGKGAKAKEVSLESISGLVAEGPDPLEELGRRRARPIVYTALSRLSDRERDRDGALGANGTEPDGNRDRTRSHRTRHADNPGPGDVSAPADARNEDIADGVDGGVIGGAPAAGVPEIRVI